MIYHVPDAYMLIVIERMASGAGLSWKNACFGNPAVLTWNEEGESYEMPVPADTMRRLMAESWVVFEDHKDMNDIYILPPEHRRLRTWVYVDRRRTEYNTRLWNAL